MQERISIFALATLALATCGGTRVWGTSDSADGGYDGAVGTPGCAGAGQCDARIDCAQSICVGGGCIVPRPASR